MTPDDKYPESLFKELHDQVVRAFETSEFYQSKFGDTKISKSQLYGRGTFAAELPTLQVAVRQKTGVRFSKEWLYKRVLEGQKNATGHFIVTLDNKILYDGLAQYLDFTDFAAFAASHINRLPPVVPAKSNIGSLLNPFAELAGLYEAYIVLPQTRTMSVLVVLLNKEGKVQIRSKLTAINRFYKGTLELVPRSRILLGAFELKDPDFEKHKYYKYFFVLRDRFEVRSPWPKGVITGVYAGKGKRSEDPMAGRIRLYRVKEEYDGIEDDFMAYEPKEISLQNPDFFDEIRDKKELIPFFSGNRDDFMESVALFEQLELIEKTHPVAGIKNVAGCYLCYTLASDRKTIFERPVCIQPNGIAMMRLATPPTALYRGRAVKLNDMLLSIRFHTRTDEQDQPYSGYFLFYATNTPRSDIKRIFGTFVSANDRKQPLAGRAILIPAEGAFDNLVSRKIQLFSDDYNELDRCESNLMRFLTGDANNLIKSFRDIDSPFEKEQDYADIYFGAACYKASTAPTQAATLLGYAFMHGFRDWDKLHMEKTSGFLQHLTSDHWEQAKSNIDSRLHPVWEAGLGV
ncbi:MAG: hypothetical protein JNN12_08005 [Bacteroidetes Order II. Incertae sedis bacterium]|nr:hypothetical protein [Bacteroidetes Order II. bacterium]